ncbi:MAG: DUF2029 domain-containing protein [Deltaproteobacteria bacterium]|nr:MAG: DUF2029 domain-containing protein [Deltaproteobacteria bacterium]
MSAYLLHSAESRPDAATLVPLLWVWGLAATAPALRKPELALSTVMFAAMAVRLPLIGSPPLFSDDLYRYVFEGIALNAGHNPFTEAPASLEGLAEPLRAQVNHPTYTSIYPPLALLWFRLLGLGGTATFAQAATAAVDVCTAAFLFTALRRRDAPTWPALVYALHPLPAVESAVGAHVDLFAASLLAAALAWPRHATGLAVLGAGAKLLPVAALPATLRERPVREHLPGLLVAGALLVLGAWPVLDAGSDLFASFGTYTQHWRFNALALPLLEPLLGEATRPALILAGVGVSAWAAWRLRDPAALVAVVGTAFLVLSPTVHPWYAVWALVPSLVLGRWGWSLAATALMGSYAVLGTLDVSTGRWDEGAWVAWLSWGPALAALAAETVTRRGRR